MPRINVLPKKLSELIAAGEVVERPASAVKEMIENSLDAGAKHITVEIEHGGISYIRITDDGCGIAKEDVKTAFLRHATSKIKTEQDLGGIKTLGFRGEALASLAAVAKIEMFTRARGEEYGTRYVIEGGAEILSEDSGCPEGTTVIVRDLFYNTPARMKFLKKDSTEGAAVAAVAERAAISNPQVAFKFIRDGRQAFVSAASGDLKTAIHSVLGKEFAENLIEVKGGEGMVRVGGYCSAPFACRASRAGQYTYLNHRLVISKTVMAAVEQAYKNSVMVGKFPAFVLFVDMPYEAVDVNVHPAKTEVRFADEKAVFSAVYAAVRGALAGSDARPAITFDNKRSNPFFGNIDAGQFRQIAADLEGGKKPDRPERVSGEMRLNEDAIPFFLRKEYVREIEKRNGDFSKKPQFGSETYGKPQPAQEPKAETPREKEETQNPITEGVILIGEVFKTYIIAQKGESVFILDKHACHERIIFNRLKRETAIECQPLLAPVSVHLSAAQYSAVLENEKTMAAAGIELEDFGNETVLVRAVPGALAGEDVADIITEAAQNLVSGGSRLSPIDDILHTVACKAATKAGYNSSDEELLALANEVLSSNEVLYCPHGRPVAFELKRRELEKRFGRIQ
ncbi:MAG: DNA mismatch repair endonuclease MutL [Clostridia bacterium]|nr:DNA mismatch repair endonuclease MutL [Clostridia bacterium]